MMTNEHDDGGFRSWLLGGGLFATLLASTAIPMFALFPLGIVVVREWSLPRPFADCIAAFVAMTLIMLVAAANSHSSNALFVWPLIGGLFAVPAALSYWSLAGYPRPPYV